MLIGLLWIRSNHNLIRWLEEASENDIHHSRAKELQICYIVQLPVLNSTFGKQAVTFGHYMRDSWSSSLQTIVHLKLGFMSVLAHYVLWAKCAQIMRETLIVCCAQAIIYGSVLNLLDCQIRTWMDWKAHEHKHTVQNAVAFSVQFMCLQISQSHARRSSV